MTMPVQYDAEFLKKLGLTPEQAQELEAQGIPLEEYAKRQCKRPRRLEENAEIVPVRYRIVAQAAAFQNEATGEIVQKLRGSDSIFSHNQSIVCAAGRRGKRTAALQQSRRQDWAVRRGGRRVSPIASAKVARSTVRFRHERRAREGMQDDSSALSSGRKLAGSSDSQSAAFQPSGVGSVCFGASIPRATRK